jgi:hypothetical protein
LSGRLLRVLILAVFRGPIGCHVVLWGQARRYELLIGHQFRGLHLGRPHLKIKCRALRLVRLNVRGHVMRQNKRTGEHDATLRQVLRRHLLLVRFARPDVIVQLMLAAFLLGNRRTALDGLDLLALGSHLFINLVIVPFIKLLLFKFLSINHIL